MMFDPGKPAGFANICGKSPDPAFRVDHLKALANFTNIKLGSSLTNDRHWLICPNEFNDIDTSSSFWRVSGSFYKSLVELHSIRISSSPHP